MKDSHDNLMIAKGEIGNYDLSRYCTGIICPHPKNNRDGYIDFLLNLGKKLNHKGVLFPIGDVELLATLKNRRKLEQYYHMPIAELEVVEKFLNKRSFYKTLEKFNIPHPKTYFPRDISDVEAISKKYANLLIKEGYTQIEELLNLTKSQMSKLAKKSGIPVNNLPRKVG